MIKKAYTTEMYHQLSKLMIKNLNKIHISNYTTDDLPSVSPLNTNSEDESRHDTPCVSIMLELEDLLIQPNLQSGTNLSPASLPLRSEEIEENIKFPEPSCCDERMNSTETKILNCKEEVEIEEFQCCICLSDFMKSDVYTTKCNHTTCTECIIKLYELKKTSIQCPMCRGSIYEDIFCTFIKDEQRKKNSKLPPFAPHKYPVDVDWSFITSEHTRRMIRTAYEAVQHLEKWEFLYNFEIDEETGFMFCKDPEINIIMDEVDRFYACGHSGSTMGITMRHLHFISKYGLEDYRLMTQ